VPPAEEACAYPVRYLSVSSPTLSKDHTRDMSDQTHFILYFFSFSLFPSSTVSHWNGGIGEQRGQRGVSGCSDNQLIGDSL
jgi:hypothetical protein